MYVCCCHSLYTVDPALNSLSPSLLAILQPRLSIYCERRPAIASLLPVSRSRPSSSKSNRKSTPSIRIFSSVLRKFRLWHEYIRNSVLKCRRTPSNHIPLQLIHLLTTYAFISTPPEALGFPSPSPKHTERFCSGQHWVCDFTQILPLPIHLTVKPRTAFFTDMRKYSSSPFSVMPVPTFHLSGIYTQILQPVYGVVPMAVYPPTATFPDSLPIFPSPTNILEHSIKTGCKAMMTLPALVTALSRTPAALDFLKDLDVLVSHLCPCRSLAHILSGFFRWHPPTAAGK